jgi:hypothetical protein
VPAFNTVGIAAFDGVADAEVLRTFVDDDAETRRRFHERGDGDVDSMVGAYPARWQAFHLAGELATHADDVFAPVGADEAAARLTWRARFSRFALQEARPDFVIEVVDDCTRVRRDGLDVVLDDDDLVAAVAGRADGTRLPDEIRTVLSTMP